jgi:hypothetical protein
MIGVYKILFSVCILFFGTQTMAQDQFERLRPKYLRLIREKCNCDMQGYRYRIVYDDSDINEQTYCDYSFDPVYYAADSLKIPILQQLLRAIDDTSICCNKVERYGAKAGKAPVSKRYTLQIDALYIFNFVAFGVYAKHYSPYPILLDTVSGMEVNDDSEKIKEVYAIYTTWLKKATENGFKNYAFPLINTRYQWYGSLQRTILLKKMPHSPTHDNLGRPQSFSP